MNCLIHYTINMIKIYFLMQPSVFKKNINLKFILLGTWTPFNPETVRLMIGKLIIPSCMYL